MKRIALVSGGAQGLGRAIAERLAADGLEIILADLQRDIAESTAAAMRATGATVTALALDIGDEQSVISAYAEIERRFGRLDVLVNNAGVPGLEAGKKVSIEQMSLDTWERTLRVNLTGTMLMCRGAVPLLRKGVEGRIVNMSSRTARGRTSLGVASYATSKAALIGLTQVLAGELGPDGITVNSVAPSSVRTPMTLATSGGQQDYFERAAAITAVGRVGEPEDVADAVAYLCSPEARFVTGTAIDVNGGSLMH